MNSLLLILFLGASVALAELPFEHPALAEFLEDEGDEIMGEFADEENDALRPHRPSGRPSRFPRPSPPAFVRQCRKKLRECLLDPENSDPCDKLACLKKFGECLKENLPSPRPTLPFTVPPRVKVHLKFCFGRTKKCMEEADNCKEKLKCIFCLRRCLKKQPSRICHRFRPSGRPFPSGRPRPSGRPSRRPRPSGRPSKRPRPTRG